MLDEIGDVSNIDKFIAKAKDKNDPFKLMGSVTAFTRTAILARL